MFQVLFQPAMAASLIPASFGFGLAIEPATPTVTTSFAVHTPSTPARQHERTVEAWSVYSFRAPYSNADYSWYAAECAARQEARLTMERERDESMARLQAEDRERTLAELYEQDAIELARRGYRSDW